MPWPPGWPPLELAGHLPVAATYAALWAAVILGGGGVIAGLAAVARGARFPARLLIAAAFVAVAAFAMLPPAGSTDSLNYATFGRIAVLGHNPYVMTPNQLERAGDPIGRLATQIWRRHGSLYGPLATAEQWAAAELGGTSPARIIFWLKLWNAIVFLGVVRGPGPDAALRPGPAGAGAPALVAEPAGAVGPDGQRPPGHVRRRRKLLRPGPGTHPPGRTARVAGAGDPGAGAARRAGRGRPGRGGRGLHAHLPAAGRGAGLGAAAVARRAARRGGRPGRRGRARLPVGGPPLVHSLLLRRGKVSADNFYQLFSAAYRHPLPPSVDLAVVLVFAALALLLLWRLPDVAPDLPALQPALAIGIAWLFVWYYQLPWYDVMIIALLALYPASRLDYVVIGAADGGLAGDDAGRQPARAAARLAADVLP